MRMMNGTKPEVDVFYLAVLWGQSQRKAILMLCVRVIY
jgi:hypothetical protein